MTEPIQHAEPAKAPPMNPEQAADLAALKAAAMQAGPPGQPSDIDGPAVRPELAAEVAALMALAASALSPAFPSLKQIYTEQTTAAAGHAIAAVCQKHGWLANGIGGKYAEEIACAAVLLPLSWATYNGIVADIEERQKDKPKTEPALAGVPMPSEEPTIAQFPMMTAAVTPEPAAA